jgi:hypothetical protein
MVDIPLFLREEADRERWINRVDPLTEFQLQCVQAEKTTQEQAELWILNNMGMPTYLQCLAFIEDRYPYMPAAMQQRVVWSQSDMWLRLWTAAFACKPVFTVLQLIFLAFYACGPVATIENIKLWVVHNFPWHSLGPAYLRTFAPIESAATISFFSGYVELNYSTIEVHIGVVLRRVMRSFTPRIPPADEHSYTTHEALGGHHHPLVRPPRP